MYQRFRTSFTRHLFESYLKWVDENPDLKEVILQIDPTLLNNPQRFDSVLANDKWLYIDISPNAVRDTQIGTDGITFTCNIQGHDVDMRVPYQAMSTIYSVNTDGISCAEVVLYLSWNHDLRWINEDEKEPPAKTTPPEQKRPTLRLVK